MTPDDKKKLFSLFNNIKKEDIENRKEKNLNSDILIIDLMNTYIRSFMVSPELNSNGDHVGGISGALKSIGYAIRLLKPTRVIAVCDGDGGSLKRRKIFPGYKSGRKTRIRLNRMYTDVCTPDIEDRGLKLQLYKLVQYLDCLPITTISIDQIEADDTIAYLCTEYFKEKSESITIMSADKDFIQLVTDKVKVWSPTKKKLYGPLEVVNEYGISSKNFIFFRTMDGDASDNIDGIKGAGIKTILKAFPSLKDESALTLKEIIKYSEDNRTKLKIYENIASNVNTMERNYALMQLNTSDIQSFTQLRINEVMEKEIPVLDKIKITTYLSKDQMFDSLPNHHVWMQETFSLLQTLAHPLKNNTFKFNI